MLLSAEIPPAPGKRDFFVCARLCTVVAVSAAVAPPRTAEPSTPSVSVFFLASGLRLRLFIEEVLGAARVASNGGNADAGLTGAGGAAPAAGAANCVFCLEGAAAGVPSTTAFSPTAAAERSSFAGLTDFSDATDCE